MKKGDKVRYTGVGGFKLDRKCVEVLGVRIDDVLTIHAVSKGEETSDLYFDEIKGGHNSKMFEVVA